ncbi:MAG: DUF1284 domain-containing protein [Candidatus Omnitrophica bacterium]|nr:DUF1284 domain-containing protein [Candidatus Omnitrophota bacterium]MBU1047087.1 DUF1284 domain-containing protein [Candidatus Omnitrophota bacterium]MBU1631539.1 DUF1284 domain-containing protein [Candidatus Omnitrophota bacterium]MBU1766823.1 DUF1284 domain-containing protein [Candidatus Omnitrophota bacterium]MBU1888753.1 DUF1284 domain-containing protein [Candidatus Omnitrophota bacterium]
MDTIQIRAHHLLCIQGFQGHGYSADFVSNMTQVIKDLKYHNREIEITSECDVICRNCPYNKKEVCIKNSDSAVKLNEMDTKVLRKLGLKKGIKVKFEDALSLIKKMFKKPDIQDICKDCSWNDKCLLVSSYENL